MGTRALPWSLISKDKYGTVRSAAELMQVTGLDWTVSLADVTAIVDDVHVDIDNTYATVRNNKDGSKEVLSTVGTRYNVFQNTEIFQSLDFLMDTGEARYAAAGELAGGKIVYAIMEIPDGIQVAGDPHATYLVARSSHDGTTSFEIAAITSRLACTNQMNASFRKSKSKYSLKHTQNNYISQAEIRGRINMIYKDITEYSDLANHLIQQEFSDKEFSNFLNAMYPIDSHVLNTSPDMWTRGQAIAFGKQTRNQDNAWSVWKNDTETIDNIKGTKFAAFQAIIENYDHMGTKKQTAARMAKVITGKDIDYKVRALSLLGV